MKMDKTVPVGIYRLVRFGVVWLIIIGIVLVIQFDNPVLREYVWKGAIILVSGIASLAFAIIRERQLSR